MNVTDKRRAANRRNALKSTGPRTDEGKARTSLNALKHGLRAASLAVPHLEDPEDWEVHRRLVLQDLAPTGYLEAILAERIAATLWRLGRVVRYESATVSKAIEDAKDHYTVTADEDPEAAKERAERFRRVRALKPSSHVDGEDVGLVLDLVAEAFEVDLSDDKIAGEVEVPEGFSGGHWSDFDGWTRGALEAAVQSVARMASDEYSREDPWEEAHKTAETEVVAAREARERRAVDLDRKRKDALLPDEETLEKVSRYETTLERSLFRTLHELQRLQAARGGLALPPPAAVDMDLAVHQSG
jgi:hypothetical protein